MNGQRAVRSRSIAQSISRSIAPHIALAFALAAAFPVVAASDGLDDAMTAGDLICDFNSGFSRALVAHLGRARPPRGLLMLYESVDPQLRSAQVVSSQSAGRKPVLLRRTERAVHLIEPLLSTVRVTTLTGCLDWRVKRGVDTCVRFAASHAWHFDDTVLADPDATHARQRRGATSGACEPWTLD